MKALREFRKHLTGIFSNRPFLAIFVVAFLVRIVGVFLGHQYLDVERYELERTALSLAQTGVYGNPYSLPTGPSAHVAPGYTLILAAIFKLFGAGVGAEIVKQVFASAVSAFQCALILPVARAMRLDARVGLLTATFKALLPVKFGTETMGDWEAPYTAIALMLLSILMVRLYTEKNFNTRRAVLAGVAWGVGVLFASALLPILAASVLVGILFAWKRGRRLGYLRFCAIEILLVAACLAPWAIRNYYALGAPVATRTNLGLELRISNNDLASGDEHVNYANGLYQKYHPLQNPGEALAVRQMGEVAYNQHAEQQALAWIRTHPQKFLRLTIQRARLFWFYIPHDVEPLQRFKYFILGLIHLIGLFGLVYLSRRNQVSAIVLSMILLLYPIPNYFIHVGPRQSYPVDWILDLLMFALMVPLAQIVLSRLRGRRPVEQLISSAGPESEAVTFSDGSQKS